MASLDDDPCICARAKSARRPKALASDTEGARARGLETARSQSSRQRPAVRIAKNAPQLALLWVGGAGASVPLACFARSPFGDHTGSRPDFRAWRPPAGTGEDGVVGVGSAIGELRVR